MQEGFLENDPSKIAVFLLNRKGLSKQKVGEYLGNIQDPSNIMILRYILLKMDFSDMNIDAALRKFLSHFHISGEAQIIEKIMEMFSQRYKDCNQNFMSKLKSQDTLFILAFATIMLNTDLHNYSMKSQKRMKMNEFVKNLKGLDNGYDISKEILVGIFERIKKEELKSDPDHVTQVFRLEQAIVGKKPVLALPFRRLVCYCRLYEIGDFAKKEKLGTHQREVFLFNDLLVICKLLTENKLNKSIRGSEPSLIKDKNDNNNFKRSFNQGRFTKSSLNITPRMPQYNNQFSNDNNYNVNCSLRKTSEIFYNSTTYKFRKALNLVGMTVETCQNQYYKYLIRINNNNQIINLNAKSEHDRTKFVEDLKESIAENEEMKTFADEIIKINCFEESNYKNHSHFKHSNISKSRRIGEQTDNINENILDFKEDMAYISEQNSRDSGVIVELHQGNFSFVDFR
ncbi:IQ motif and SEC7 domain-containing protein 1-like [Gordionus sp. m RMFG-2023]|uniref:IQ motif and SEC7 domain-containing protein 1-like n=1 Tax=Gordionus sp. m RMFG-2023 TaxID=3053472 RepID=UPI0031FD78BF